LKYDITVVNDKVYGASEHFQYQSSHSSSDECSMTTRWPLIS